MMKNGKKLEFPEGREGVRGNRRFPLASSSLMRKLKSFFQINEL
jgi:hypothetical protein